MESPIIINLIFPHQRFIHGGLAVLDELIFLAELAHLRLERGLDGLVAQARLLVGLDPLELGLDVRHA